MLPVDIADLTIGLLDPNHVSTQNSVMFNVTSHKYLE